MDDRFAPAIEALKEDVDRLLREAVDAKKAANMLAKRAGLEPIYDDVEVPAAFSGSKTAIRPDQFANFTTPSTAARAYLESRQHLGAASIETIFEALQRGGFAFTAKEESAKNGLSIALGKDAKVRYLKGSQTYGLWAWYPNAKRDKERRSPTLADGSTDTPDDVESDDADEAEASESDAS